MYERDMPFLDRLGRFLMYAGFGVALIGVGAWMLDVIPVMPAWMLRLAVFKLTIASAAGMLFAGAALRRAVRKRATTPALREHASLIDGGLDLDRPVGRERESDRVSRT